jgi:hypothetical protein
MRENNPFEDSAAPADGSSSSADPASANALDALNEPKKAGFFGALKNRLQTQADNNPVATSDTPPADSPPASASDFSGSDSAYQPLINESPTPPSPQPETAPVEPQSSFKKTPPIAIDGVSPDYNALSNNQTPGQPAAVQYDQIAQPTAQQYEALQPEQPYAPLPEQPMIYQQPATQDYYQQPTDPYQANQPLPVNYGTAPNIYDPYNPYATMVDLNPNAPDPNKKPDWRFVITFSIAFICFAGMIFFAISYTSASNLSKDTEAQLIELENKANENTKSASQVEDLQNTVRDLTSKNETLQESNDSLKKNEDKVKELETQLTTAQTERQSWMDKYYDALTKCGDKCANSSSSSSSSSTD